MILVGGGGHCKSCIDVIEAEGKFRIAGIVDLPEKVGDEILGYPIIATDNDLEELATKYKYFHITIGQIKSAALRIRIYFLLKRMGAELPVIKSPLAYVSKTAEIGEGTIVMHNVLVNSEAKIGNNCILNTGSLIEHESEIGAYSHISTNVVINGQCQIGEATFIGSGSIIINNLTLKKEIVLGAGSLVTKDLNGKTTYIGCPVRRIK
ncbi:MAG: acetyltransferase [Bacteroidales bacterium]|nr:acetyltransferase [Bacteroidales bacterium]